jgi:hypothetical protein
LRLRFIGKMARESKAMVRVVVDSKIKVEIRRQSDRFL